MLAGRIVVVGRLCCVVYTACLSRRSYVDKCDSTPVIVGDVHTINGAHNGEEGQRGTAGMYHHDGFRS